MVLEYKDFKDRKELIDAINKDEYLYGNELMNVNFAEADKPIVELIK